MPHSLHSALLAGVAPFAQAAKSARKAAKFRGTARPRQGMRRDPSDAPAGLGRTGSPAQTARKRDARRSRAGARAIQLRSRERTGRIARRRCLAAICFCGVALPLVAQHASARGGSPARAAVARGGAAATALLAARLLRTRRRGGLVFVSPAGVSFNATDPASQPLVGASAPLQVRVFIFRPQANANWSLSLAANAADFTGASGAIPVSAVTYTSSGTVAANDGAITTPAGSIPLAASPTAVANGTEGAGRFFSAQVSCNFVFHDSWNYVPGTYTQTVTFTLATP